MITEIYNELDYVRVTDVLQKYSGLENVPPFVLQQAADRGRRIHTYCELHACKMLFGHIDDDCLPYVQAFIEWFDENVDEVLFTEKRFFCHELFITGQIDLIVKIKNNPRIALIDIKTGSKPSKTWNLQTAAYKYLAKMNGVEINQVQVLHLKKDQTHNLLEFQDYYYHFSVFLSLLNAYRYFT